MIKRGMAMVRRVPAPGWMLLALAMGFGGGIVLRDAPLAMLAAGVVGGVWLDALRMTILPLVFALVATGIADLAGGDRREAATLGRRLPLTLLAALVSAACVSALLAPLLVARIAVPGEALAGLRASLAPAGAAPPAPTTVEAIRAMVPTNVVASAAAGAMVPVVIFAAVLGIAATRVPDGRTAPLVAMLRGLGEAMIVVVGWVLRAAAVGIAALAFTLGATMGVAAIGVLGQYVVASALLSLVLIVLGYVAARVVGRVPLWRFARAIAPAQAVAAGTQSSVATLPAMLAGAARIGVPADDAAVALPMAVAVFKITAPSNTLLVALTVAALAGVPVSPAQVVLAIPLALLSTLVILGLPGAVSAYASVTPTIVALGAPLELVPILLAVDVLPDIVRTVANVTWDVAVTAIVSRPDPPGD